MKKKLDIFTLITWEQVAEIMAMDPVMDLPYPNPKNDRQEAANAYIQWDVISEVFNGDNILDWTNNKQRKWGIWLNNYTPGSGWSFGVSTNDWTYSHAGGGARLRFAEEKISDHFAKYFMNIINKLNKPQTKK